MQKLNISKRLNIHGFVMSLRLTALALATLVAVSVSAQEARMEPTGSSAVGSSQELSKKHVEIVRKVNAYFNQLTSLRGSFVQISADSKRQRGKFHISRPGRFRFEFNLPSKVVIISDGKYLAIQDRDLNTDDRWDLGYTPFRALLQKDVDLLRDVHVIDAQEADDSITIAFEDHSGDASSRIKLFLAAKPAMQIKAWIVKDAQGLDTRVDLIDVSATDEPDARLFDPAAR
jgi:outer membrane lipoprotein-sorting protein